MGRSKTKSKTVRASRRERVKILGKPAAEKRLEECLLRMQESVKRQSSSGGDALGALKAALQPRTGSVTMSCEDDVDMQVASDKSSRPEHTFKPVTSSRDTDMDSIGAKRRPIRRLTKREISKCRAKSKTRTKKKGKKK